MEELADLDAALDHVGASDLDVGDDELEPLRRTRLGGGQTLTEGDRAARAERGELHRPDLLAQPEVGVEAPAEAFVEALRPVDVGDRDGDDLDPHVDRRGPHGQTAPVALTPSP